jgi:hypothetical protein
MEAGQTENCLGCLTPIGDPVVVFGDVALPICRSCYDKLTRLDRIRFALDWIDRQPGGSVWAVRRAAEAIVDRLEGPAGSLDFPPGRN